MYAYLLLCYAFMLIAGVSWHYRNVARKSAAACRAAMFEDAMRETDCEITTRLRR